RRNSLLLRARGNLGSATQLEAFAATSTWREEVAGLPEGEGPTRGIDVVGLRFSAAPGAGGVSAGIRFAGGPFVASWLADVAAWMPLGPLALEAGAEIERWNEFSTRTLRGGVSYTDTLLLPITVRGFAAGGDRGLGHPAAASADSLGFDAFGGAVDLGLGPFSLSGRYGVQRLDRPLGFGGFDQGLALDSAEVDVGYWEGRIEGPLIPVGGLLPGLEPIRIRGFWRKNESRGADALYLPDMLARGELSLHDSFFDGNLEIWLSGFVERRGARMVPAAVAPEAVILAADTWPGGALHVQNRGLPVLLALHEPVRTRRDGPSGRAVSAPGERVRNPLGVLQLSRARQPEAGS
ncbi:MAG: hypothetical protein R3266_08790, partial [Gemmatimonadota bacterium]|nr:hypothetical protein [Gemmatimonadota bacterium]